MLELWRRVVEDHGLAGVGLHDTNPVAAQF